jgi:nucleotidyltransferase substrate binding protein (TIGR01987 family)
MKKAIPEESFQRFDYGFGLLRQALERGTDTLNQLEKEGLIHRFEYCLKLAWKAARDFLEDSGVVIDPVTPREVLRQAALARILPDGQVWIDMLDHRTLLAHSYDGVVFNEVIVALAGRYFPAMEQLHAFLAGRAS